MLIIGVTGSVAMGKSEICKYFRMFNIPVFDSDKVVNNILNNQKTIKKINKYFPELSNIKTINRKMLAKIVFNNDNRLNDLETIVYPYLKKVEKKWIRRMIRERRKIVVFDVPLLFEKGNVEKYDIIVVASASKFIQKIRALKRKDWDKKRLALVLNKQMLDKNKKYLADIVIKTDRGKRLLVNVIKKIINRKALKENKRNLYDKLKLY